MGDNKDVNFEWDKNTPEIVFFGETKTEESVVETVIKDDLEIPLKKDEKTGIEKPKKEEKPEENINFFENTEKVSVPGWTQLYEIPDGKPLIWHSQEQEYLTYYEVKDDLVSAIGHTTDAPVLGIIGSDDSYNTIIRNLAAVGMTSKSIIPVHLGKYIDKVDATDLEEMDALVLYGYDYKNHSRAWDRIKNYVESGGKVLIDTGSDVKQTKSMSLQGSFPKELPEVFPIFQTKQQELGRLWDLSGRFDETKGIDLSKFGPPLLDGSPWLFSVPEGGSKEGSYTILEANGTPLVIGWNFGQGKVIWSGMNLFYHITIHKNPDEGKLFENLLFALIDIKRTEGNPSSFERESTNKVEIRGKDSKGVIFRENMYPGWGAKLKSGSLSKNLKIYKTGPTFYGFAYVRIPKEVKGDFSVIFTYHGEFWTYFWQIIWFIAVIAIIDRVFLGSKIIVPAIRKVSSKFKSKVGRWWEKEDEY